MAITRVQGNARGTGTGGTSFPVAATLSGAPVAGNILVLTGLGVNTSSTGDAYYVYINSITQTNVTWTKQVGKRCTATEGASPTGIYTEIWYGVVGASAGVTVTANYVAAAATTNGGIIDVCEYSGLLTSGFLDQTATNVSLNSTTLSTGTTGNTTQNDELWIGATGGAGALSATTQSSPTNGFTLLDGADLNISGYHQSLGFLEKIVSSTGTANSGTTAATAVDSACCIATFKATAAGGLSIPVAMHHYGHHINKIIRG